MILFLSAADTELLTLARALPGLPDGFPPVRAANPSDWGGRSEPLLALLSGARLVVGRLLGGRRALGDGFEPLLARCREAGVPLVLWPGDQEPDPELLAATSAPPEVAEAALAYLVEGGVANLQQMLRFLADRLLGSRFGWQPPAPVPWEGIYEPGEPKPLGRDGWLERHPDDGRPAVAVLFYRAHWLCGQLGFVDDLLAALRDAGCRTLAAFCHGLKGTSPGDGVPSLFRDVLLGPEGRPVVDAVLTTLSFSLGRLEASSGGRVADAWSSAALEALDLPVLQAVVSTGDRERWLQSPVGLGPLDVAMNVAMPELDGRIITVPVSFKEPSEPDPVLGVPLRRYVAEPDRVALAAGCAARWARLRRKPNAEKRLAIVLTNYPARNSRIGNAVGLDTPASVVVLLRALAAAGYRVDDLPADGDRLIHALIDRCSNDREMGDEQLARAAGYLDGAAYGRAFDALPAGARAAVAGAWGAPPGEVLQWEGDLVVPGLPLGNVFVGIQPPRGFGENPVAVYHSPDLPPTHHYLGYYRWLRDVFRADAVIHVGKHGTLEWLPGKGIGLSAGCFPEAALGELPHFYPFIVNNPGEGTQAKRRSHACIVDHLIPVMTTAEVYDDLARLEQLLDQYYQVQSMDPGKLPLLRRAIWEVVVRARLDRDLGRDGEPSDFDAFLPEVDGYLCELKTAQIRDGLHVLGQQPPTAEAWVDLCYALLRLPNGDVPSLPGSVAESMGLDWDRLRDEPGRRLEGGPYATCGDAWQAVEARSRAWLGEALGGGPPEAPPRVAEVLRHAVDDLVPRLRRTSDEIGNLVAGLEGRFVPPGPSGAPTRGMAAVLPTGRNFYSVDPRALPSPAAWEVGRQLGERLLQRYRGETGGDPESVGIVVWGTAAMRTQGDDIAEVLWLLGTRPVWQAESGRVTGIEVVPLEELGRPRIDVTVRLSGFFRDAFPNLIHLMDDAVRAVALRDEPVELNFVRKHWLEDVEGQPAGGSGGPGGRSSALYRLFGSKPGAYGTGLLPLLEGRRWRGDEDLARVYVTWGGYAYTRTEYGAPAPAEFRRRLSQVSVATKNQDNREHDIFDSDDYFQEHGGMVATIRALTGSSPRSYFGDSSDPARVRVRDLADEARRVYRTRVVNPRWIASVRRHGYKGALELAATVDFLFGYDATARVVEDWMYEGVAAAYALDAEMQRWFQASNPWALRDVAERLIEAAQRGLWSQPSPETLRGLQGVLLEAEGWVEGRGG